MELPEKFVSLQSQILQQPLARSQTAKLHLRRRISIMDLIKIAEQAFQNEKVASYPEFKAGDTITVTYRIKEGDKERLQKFRGVVIQIKGMDPFTRTFTVRKVSSGVGVERIFPYQSPFIDSIEVNKVGKVRRARIFYLRDLTGKKARIKEKVYSAEKE